MVHRRVSGVWRLLCFLNGTQMSASCMENVTLMEHKRGLRLWRMSRSFNGTQMSPRVWRMPRCFNGANTITSCTENSMLHQWDISECLMCGECHTPVMAQNWEHCVWIMTRSFNGTQVIIHGLKKMLAFDWSMPRAYKTNTPGL